MRLPQPERDALAAFETALNCGTIPGRLREIHLRWQTLNTARPFGQWLRRYHREAFVEAADWREIKDEKLRSEHSRWENSAR